MLNRNPLSIGFQLRHRTQHCTIILYKHRFYSNTTYQCCTHINIASISLYCNLLSIRSFDTTLMQKSHFTQHHFHVDFTQHRQHSSVAPPATILPASSPLDLRFNLTELFKIIARAVLLSQLNCIFSWVINHNACCRNGIFKNCCSQFIPFDFIQRIFKVMDILQSCAQPQDYFRCCQLRLFCISVSCKSSTVVYFLYGAFSKRIVLWLLRLILWVLNISIMFATPLE